MTKRQRGLHEASLSFLDVITCGFGAIVLLLLIARPAEDIGALEPAEDLDGKVEELQEQLFEIRGEARTLNRRMTTKEEQLSDIRLRVARLQDQLSRLQEQRQVSPEFATEKEELTLALQVLTEEMERLQGQDFRRQSATVGGIPVDSEYIIFIIDTSGSMTCCAWSKMLREMENILSIYPTVKGIQVMNDMGNLMFSSYHGEWIPDTPGRRQLIMQRLSSWTPFSNSSPVEGVQNAIRSFYDPEKKISLYILGDDFTGNSITRVVDTVDRLNRERRSGERLVRIHAIGFPVHFLMPGGRMATASRFAALMRELSHRNGGTFVGLNALD